MNRVSRHLRANAVAYIALFVALGGTGYAAMRIPAASVGARQLKNHSITPSKLNPQYIAASIRAWVNVQWSGTKLVAKGSSSRVRISTVSDGDGITWPHRHFRRDCMASVTPQVNFTVETAAGGYVTADFDPTNPPGAFLFLHGFGPDGSPRAQAASILIVCPPER
jgi:hypothetical protein